MKEMEAICRLFAFEGRLIHAEPYGCGHINDTYCLWFDRGGRPPRRYILQRINTDIFRDVDGLMRNIAAVTEHIRAGLRAEGRDDSRGTLTVIPTVDGGLYARTDDGCYRAYVFLENTVSLQTVENRDRFAALGRAFGRFQKQLADFDASSLVETIPDFHNTVRRCIALEAAVKRDAVGRAASVAAEIAFADAKKGEAGVLIEGAERGELPVRVTHNDTKLNNVLFDIDSGETAVIDLDTVMPGLVLYDFGDSIRFGASTAAEDEKDLSRVGMDLTLFEAYAEGFLETCGDMLTSAERELLPFSARLMTYECGVRFLTDYLEGDVYFKTHYPGQNLDRCRTQFRLVADMEGKQEQMRRIINRITARL